MTISPPESGEKNKKVLEDPVKADPRPIDFAKLDKPGFWSSKLSKGPKTTTWIGLNRIFQNFFVFFSTFWWADGHLAPRK